MSDIKNWSSTAASNNSAPPDGAPEGMSPSDLNNSLREVMASVRRQHEDAEWIDLGDTPTYSSATSFTLSGDVAASYSVGRRVKITDSITLYGVITASSYSTPSTTVTVTLDAGTITSSISAVAIGILSAVNNSIPKADAVLGDVTTNSHTTGTGTITDLVLNTSASGSAVLDEDDMASDSATKLATQQSIKAYTDNRIKAGSVYATTGTGTVTGDASISYSWSGNGCTLTHNLGTANYAVVATCLGGTNHNIAVSTLTSNTVLLYSYTADTGASSAQWFSFFIKEF